MPAGSDTSGNFAGRRSGAAEPNRHGRCAAIVPSTQRRTQMNRHSLLVRLALATLLPLRAFAQTPATSPAPQDPVTVQVTVQVTATRFGEPVEEVPGAISVVTGDEMRARGVTDLRTALALLGGVSV